MTHSRQYSTYDILSYEGWTILDYIHVHTIWVPFLKKWESRSVAGAANREMKKETSSCSSYKRGKTWMNWERTSMNSGQTGSTRNLRLKKDRHSWRAWELCMTKTRSTLAKKKPELTRINHKWIVYGPGMSKTGPSWTKKRPELTRKIKNWTSGCGHNTTITKKGPSSLTRYRPRRAWKIIMIPNIPNWNKII